LKQEDFDDLVESVKQAGRIKRGDTQASRRFRIGPSDIKSIRRKLNKSQS